MIKNLKTELICFENDPDVFRMFQYLKLSKVDLLDFSFACILMFKEEKSLCFWPFIAAFVRRELPQPLLQPVR